MLDDGLPTPTSRDQAELEARVLALYRELVEVGFSEEDPDLVLSRKQHAKYLGAGLGELPSGFIALDASRAWICYWITHGLALLGAPLPAAVPRPALLAFLASCQHPGGGFGGGPYQLAHLAPTYAGARGRAPVCVGAPVLNLVRCCTCASAVRQQSQQSRAVLSLRLLLSQPWRRWLPWVARKPTPLWTGRGCGGSCCGCACRPRVAVA